MSEVQLQVLIRGNTKHSNESGGEVDMSIVYAQDIIQQAIDELVRRGHRIPDDLVVPLSWYEKPEEGIWHPGLPMPRFCFL